ncbi:MAG TPA: sulfur carrier protein ThiS [Campylobacterales bacterium]|nr:sulfur carrier protein ThiS [Campylobacterales bacterium]
MKISVNGEIKEFDIDNLTVKKLLEELKYGKGIAVALNETFILKTKYEETTINDGDRVDILSPVQGG